MPGPGHEIVSASHLRDESIQFQHIKHLAEALRRERLRWAAPRPARRRMEPRRGARLGRRPPVRLLVRLTPRVHQV